LNVEEEVVFDIVAVFMVWQHVTSENHDSIWFLKCLWQWPVTVCVWLAIAWEINRCLHIFQCCSAPFCRWFIILQILYLFQWQQPESNLKYLDVSIYLYLYSKLSWYSSVSVATRLCAGCSWELFSVAGRARYSSHFSKVSWRAMGPI
jgi:hypothetical protein